jgi:hypothetical protein
VCARAAAPAYRIATHTRKKAYNVRDLATINDLIADDISYQ